jgi:hypothetical protein
MLGAVDNSCGVHPKMASQLENVFERIEKVGGDIREDKRRRKMPRTWADSTENTMYLD